MMQLTKEELERGAWYYGDGRLGPVAMWSGTMFMSFSYAWGHFEGASMVYGNTGFSPYAIIDRSFTPTVLQAINDALFGDYKRLIPKVPDITSLQEMKVIEVFLKEFMEVGTYQLNVETQIELLKLAIGTIAVSRTDDADELRAIARTALSKLGSLRK
jgi:hypothetical protein